MNSKQTGKKRTFEEAESKLNMCRLVNSQYIYVTCVLYCLVCCIFCWFPTVLEVFTQARKRLETESHRIRYVTNDKIPRSVKWRVSETREWMDKKNRSIDANILNEIDKLVCILKQLITDNNIGKLQQLISMGICQELEKHCNSIPKSDSVYDCQLSKIITDIVGLILEYNRIECLSLLNAFLDLSLFDVAKFDKDFKHNPLQCLMFLCEKYKNDSTPKTSNKNEIVKNGHYKYDDTGSKNYTPTQTQAITETKSKSKSNRTTMTRASSDSVVMMQQKQQYQERNGMSRKKLFNIKSCHCKMLHKCCEAGFYDCVSYCLSLGCDVKICSNRAIRDSARFGHLEIVKLLIAHGADSHACREESLRKACRHGHFEIVKYLCEIDMNSEKNNNSNCNSNSNNDNYTNSNKKRVAKTADISARNFQCIEWATNNGHNEIVAYLLNKCVKMQRMNAMNDIRTIRRDLMQIAINSDHFDSIVPLLIVFGFGLFVADYAGLIVKGTRRIINTNNNESELANNGTIMRRQNILNAIWKGFDQRWNEIMIILQQHSSSDDVSSIICLFERNCAC